MTPSPPEVTQTHVCPHTHTILSQLSLQGACVAKPQTPPAESAVLGPAASNASIMATRGCTPAWSRTPPAQSFTEKLRLDPRAWQTFPLETFSPILPWVRLQAAGKARRLRGARGSRQEESHGLTVLMRKPRRRGTVAKMLGDRRELSPPTCGVQGNAILCIFSVAVSQAFTVPWALCRIFYVNYLVYSPQHPCEVGWTFLSLEMRDVGSRKPTHLPKVTSFSEAGQHSQSGGLGPKPGGPALL